MGRIHNFRLFVQARRQDFISGVATNKNLGGRNKHDNFLMSGTLADKKLKNFDDFFDKIIEKFSIFLMKL